MTIPEVDRQKLIDAFLQNHNVRAAVSTFVGLGGRAYGIDWGRASGDMTAEFDCALDAHGRFVISNIRHKGRR